MLLGALGAGLGLGAGLAINTRMSRHTAGPVGASLINFLVGALVALVLVLFGVGGRPDLNAAWALPLGTFLGGAVGALYVALSLSAAASLGVTVSTALVVLGQLIVSRLVDAFGWLGQPVRPLEWPQVLGAALLLGAVAYLQWERNRTPGS
nr:DMT family transporter [Deinobacterium chartae]